VANSSSLNRKSPIANHQFSRGRRYGCMPGSRRFDQCNSTSSDRPVLPEGELYEWPWVKPTVTARRRGPSAPEGVRQLTDSTPPGSIILMLAPSVGGGHKKRALAHGYSISTPSGLRRRLALRRPSRFFGNHTKAFSECATIRPELCGQMARGAGRMAAQPYQWDTRSSPALAQTWAVRAEKLARQHQDSSGAI
jgi:hypothetical protein